ncbi:LPXTG-motif cell wall-anchored protein [Streptomyces aurantiacus]|uniref:LAETG motif-containing sortase-dependent surface protein n=1 Tax=Streptomyces aurantiacus TaxID=47760 RepID=UPI002790A407|nr:LAETG motif-containing sortase-dependent surface protein [Streptomyces aurantiacus]MDQ0775060.1 LPXTG-motif cell wall-anchored protein [Streptomyces aurantiacus]
MKLRRVMAAAAVTAVIAPLTLLSAPAAFATETDPAGTESASTSATPDPTTTETTTPPVTTPSTTPPGSEIPSGTPDPSTSVTTTPPESPSASPDPSEEPTDPEEDAPYCEDLDENYGDAKVSADIKGLPGKIVAGDGAHAFELVVTNESKEELKGVAFYAEIENYELDESKFLSKYVTLEFKNDESGKWERIGDENWAGDYFFYVEALKAKASQTVDLRFSVDKGAPAGDSYSFGSGAYVDNIDGQDCIAEGWAQYDFEVLKAGSTNPKPGTATPNDNGDSKDPVKKPQGNVSDLPTGNLAETGSNSALPTIGLVGGAALVAGAGAVFIARRRKAGSDA